MASVKEVTGRSIILEQFLKTLEDDVRVFVRERNPESSEEAAKLADGYLQARREDPTSKDVSRRVGDKSGKHCLRCGKSGHEAKDCRVRIKPPGQEEYNVKPNSWKPKRDLKDVECFNCHNKGHYSSNCPNNAMFCTERRVDHQGSSFPVKRQAVARQGIMKEGVVEGKHVKNILLDTGCSRTIIHQDLVPENKIKDGEAVAIRFVSIGSSSHGSRK